MKVSLSWLKEYLHFPSQTPSAEQIAETLTLAGLEVEKIQKSSFTFEGIVTARVLETMPHPNADRLRIAIVFDGKEKYQVVCGAPNCREGLVTAFARIGATLQDEKGKNWTIKKNKLRDVESFGMLCSADELGLASERQEGILELSCTLPLGQDLRELNQDVIFDLSLTPNLGHCMSLYGIARELAALLPDLSLKKLSSSFQPSSSKCKPFPFAVHIENRKDCLYYSCRLVESVQVGASPEWLVRKLETAGFKSINNVVDISNYVLFLTGQPLHFFDFDALTQEGTNLFVRSHEGSSMIHTLDGEERMIPAKALVIQMEKKTVALAGIMGDLNSSISEKTKNVMIEAAVFHPTNIRKASKELSLKTEASQRFEKGVDPLMVPTALNLATELLMQLAGGVVHTETVECNLHPFTPKRIVCRKKRVESLLGISLSLGEIAKLLERLQIEIIQEHLESLEVRIPSHRNDLREEVDLIEEIARLYGLCHLPKKAPLLYTSTLVHAPLFSFENLLRDLLLQEGLQEFMTCDLISPTLSELTRDPAQLKIKTLSVLQSKSSDYSVLRHSLLPGLLQVVQYNEAHQNKDIAGFEVGRLHFEQSGVYQEPTSCAILLSGLCRPHHQDPKPCSFDFFDLKGLLENLFAALHVEDISFEPSHLPYFQPGRQAYVIQKQKALCLGALGELHPSLLKQFDLSSRAYFAELNVHHLLELHSPSLTIKDLPLYPSSERDWTVSLLKETPIEKVLACIRKLAPSLLERVFLLDLFESDKIGCDRKNATWRFIYRDPHKTLDLKTVEQKHSTLLQMVAEKLHDCIL